tara:strand:+ start:16252 stop:16989 length:738 start_codon:yes stop_codon:yes gene_type:complete
VHGRADLLEALLEEVTSAPERRRVVFLGDIVDRGPDSRLALKLVAQELEASSQSFLLLGNHEELMLKFLDERHKGGPFHIWMQNGGVATLRAFDLDPHLDPYRIAEILSDFDEVQVLRKGKDMLLSDEFAFVHAGVRPEIPLDQQARFDVRWIREPFLSFKNSFGKMIVHGHTPTATGLPELHGNRINLDTGAFATGRLSAVHLTADESAFCFLQADGSVHGGVKVRNCLPAVAEATHQDGRTSM